MKNLDPDEVLQDLDDGPAPQSSARAASSSGRSIRRLLQAAAAPLLLGLLCLFVYNANLRQIGAGDTLPARYLPLILLQDRTLDLDAHARLVARGHPLRVGRPADGERRVSYLEPSAYWTIRTREHRLASLYPIITPLLVTPLYLPAARWLDQHGWAQPQVDRVAELMEKLAASTLASAASVLIYLVLRRDAGGWSVPLTLVFAFGTNTWMISSQALWQHGTAELLIALALLLVVARPSPARTALLGGVCVLIAANRPPDGLIAGAFFLFHIWNYRRGALWLLAGAAVPLAAMLAYNLGFMGHVGGGYALPNPPRDFYQKDWSGILGLLVSPTRGLLIFSPFLIFLPVGLIQRLRSPETRGLAIVLSVAVAAQIVVYAQGDWRGGAAWGPRWLTDVLPALMWILAPAPLVLRPLARGLLILAMVASVGVQAIGAFWYTGTSDERLFAESPSPMRAAWDPGNIPFLTELQHPPARGELLCDARATIDRVGPALLPGSGAIPTLEHGAVLEGWALACGRTPAQLLVLVDGMVIGNTADFLPRVDVNDALGTSSPSGWQVVASTWGLAPGERVLQLAVRVEPRSAFRIAREQRVVVIAHAPLAATATPPPTPASQVELEAMAARAAALLRARQTQDGFWLTAHTTSRRYEDPQQEMNTFLTSMLVDTLTPLPREHGLDAALARARSHLAAQIESDGLVRYHGRPDGSIIGTLGCAITPDADDTALVWTVAGPGPGDPRLQTMLSTLARYRDVRGLYRTWLAPQRQYECIDPGHDPNPTDITIQMHVYLMLRELDPPAAQALCTALQRSSEDEDLWVYYAKSALVPYLRSAELRQHGCTLPLPIERLVLPSEGQMIWSEGVLRLVDITASPEDADLQLAIRELLVRLGSDDFAQIRRAPPLLYHNDLTASVMRFYWSEDFGYALWLRLYDAAGIAPR